LSPPFLHLLGPFLQVPNLPSEDQQLFDLVHSHGCQIIEAKGQYIKGRSHVVRVSVDPSLKGNLGLSSPWIARNLLHNVMGHVVGFPPSPLTWYQFFAGPSRISSSNRATIPFVAERQSRVTTGLNNFHLTKVIIALNHSPREWLVL